MGTVRIGVAGLTALLAAALPRAQGPEPQPEPRPGRAEVESAIHGGAAWLVAHQSPEGSWGSHHSPRPIEVLADVPGSHDAFRVATTALCVIALRDLRQPEPGSDWAASRGIDYLIEHCAVKRVSGLEHYNVWSFGYALHCFGEWLERTPGDPRTERIRAACAGLVEKLGRYQDLDGGWGYLSLNEVPTYRPSFTSMSFTTATILIGLARVRSVGVEVSDGMLGRALESLERCRMPTGAFSYGKLWNKGPLAGINQIKGAACRTPACQYALERFGRFVPARDDERGLRDLLIRHARFQEAGLRRPIPHESWYSISGYFYLYGHAYAAYVLERQPADVRRALEPEMARAVLRCREPDGSFWDYPLYSYHKPYGTAFALMALSRLDLPEE